MRLAIQSLDTYISLSNLLELYISPLGKKVGEQFRLLLMSLQAPLSFSEVNTSDTYIVFNLTVKSARFFQWRCLLPLTGCSGKTLRFFRSIENSNFEWNLNFGQYTTTLKKIKMFQMVKVKLSQSRL